MTPHYRVPFRLLPGFLWAVLTLQPRSMAHDARLAMARAHLEPEVLGGECIPTHNPCLIVCNHYTRPGFQAWWLVMAISAAVAAHRAPDAEREIRWVMTAAWTFPESPWQRRILTPLTYWAFRRVAQVYGYVTMPPMPPDPHQVEARAAAVRQTLRLARRAAQNGGLIGLAPEGRDVTGGLGHPPEGAGEFMALLTQVGLPVLPVGVAEHGGQVYISFGPTFVPDVPSARAERDQAVIQQVMSAIARQLAPKV